PAKAVSFVVVCRLRHIICALRNPAPQVGNQVTNLLSRSALFITVPCMMLAMSNVGGYNSLSILSKRPGAFGIFIITAKELLDLSS
ncbi:MAG: hypothetical protein OXR03_06725, partial [Rhodospirillaceae bacterium]|nr:hypothetical protein [Rhodospirillaceae bacterium]